MTDASGSDTTTIAWEHVYTTSPPELRRWLDTVSYTHLTLPTKA